MDPSLDTKKKNFPTPVWGDMEYTRLIILRKKAIKKFNHSPSLENYIEVKEKWHM